MKPFLFTLFVLTVSLLTAQTADSTHPSAVVAFSIDSTTQQLQAHNYDGTDDFSPLLWFLIVLYPIGGTILIGIGIAFAVIGLCILFGLVSAGILSASVITGLYKKSILKGVKTFFVLTCAASSTFVFAVLFWLLNLILHWTTFYTAILVGAVFGLLWGIGFGYTAFYVLSRLVLYFKARLSTMQLP